MYKILRKHSLAPNIKEFIIHAPEIAKKASAGNFVMIRLDEKGERIPLTIVDSDTDGTITLIVQEIGKTTKQMGQLEKGDSIKDLLGPLGKNNEIRLYGNAVVIGGGVGIAEAYPEAKALKNAGNRITSVLGAKSKDFIILEKEMNEISDEVFITTDDGSKGRKGLVTDVLKELIKQKREIDLVYAVGPALMMKAVSELTKPFGIKTLVSVNAVMLDGTGMCGVCRVTIGGDTKFACIHGPTFDGHEVDFEELITRLRMFEKKEKIALEEFNKMQALQTLIESQVLSDTPPCIQDTESANLIEIQR